MSDQTAQEPTMEEILASIRRIISEDEAPAAQPTAPADEPAATDVSAFSAELDTGTEGVDEDVLELTERVETHGDIDAYIPDAEPPEPELEPIFPLEAEPAAAQAPAPAAAPTGTLVSAATASAAASAFGQLSAAIAMPPLGLTLDEVVRELLRPLLKDWLDTHLPGIVQTAVAEEVERIARGRPR